MATRKDMQEIGRMEHLHLQPLPGGNYLKRRTPYVVTVDESSTFSHLVSLTKVPTRYNSTLAKHVKQGRLASLNSHDHHVLIEQS